MECNILGRAKKWAVTFTKKKKKLNDSLYFRFEIPSGAGELFFLDAQYKYILYNIIILHNTLLIIYYVAVARFVGAVLPDGKKKINK